MSGEFKVELVAAPTVRLVAQTRVDPEALGEWLRDVDGTEWDRIACEDISGDFKRQRLVWGWDDDWSDADVLVEAAARSCYWSYNRGRGHEDHIRNLVDAAHGSVAEHPSFTFAIAGISRSCSHEVVRHRHHSPSQLSQRYVGFDHRRIVVPAGLTDEHAAWREHLDAASRGDVSLDEWPGCDAVELFNLWYVDQLTAIWRYIRFRDRLREAKPGWSRKEVEETAREHLPECVETRMFLTGNARAWRDFLIRRGNRGADRQIRRLAVAIATPLTEAAPQLFADVEVTPDGVSVAKGRI